LCAISVAEFAHGAHRANTAERRQARRAFLDDLLIGACALERGYAIATRNQRHFQKIPGLKLILF
jgi:predicted nucleic acid-binding protein